MYFIRFYVKFITPLLVGGSDSKNLDETGLTGKALRGCWRFWFRAIIGGVLDGFPSAEFPPLLSVFEECIFGSTKKSKFRLLVEPVCMPSSKYKTLPHKPFDQGRDGYSPGSTFKISIIPRAKMMSQDEKDVLLSAIWLWANLGAIGNRARRGFGSPVICPETVPSDVFVGAELPVLTQNVFETINALNIHLERGLTSAWKKVDNWLDSDALHQYINNNCTDSVKNSFNTWSSRRKTTTPSPDIKKNAKPAGTSKADYFILKSTDQVAVCDKPYPSLYLSTDGNFTGPNGAIKTVHGTTGCDELGWAGNKHGSKKWASPVFIRFHRVMENEEEVFYPVMTWCEQNGVPASTPSCARSFLLQNIGFKNSLKGNPV